MDGDDGKDSPEIAGVGTVRLKSSGMRDESGPKGVSRGV